MSTHCSSRHPHPAAHRHLHSHAQTCTHITQNNKNTSVNPPQSLQHEEHNIPLGHSSPAPNIFSLMSECTAGWRTHQSVPGRSQHVRVIGSSITHWFGGRGGLFSLPTHSQSHQTVPSTSELCQGREATVQISK